MNYFHQTSYQLLFYILKHDFPTLLCNPFKLLHKMLIHFAFNAAKSPFLKLPFIEDRFYPLRDDNKNLFSKVMDLSRTLKTDDSHVTPSEASIGEHMCPFGILEKCKLASRRTTRCQAFKESFNGQQWQAEVPRTRLLTPSAPCQTVISAFHISVTHKGHWHQFCNTCARTTFFCSS